ncbi:nitric oxide-sensing protein NosP [Pelagibius sp. Alg239-R121]|uniref:nitric oxide-sensing protein NosP n=1 Tax=Pelagibius sp. Alg239-R121 TaxID=2993448 RepID=UPI0024A63B64|nr:nitric oxide-sensing protein NosP [Pelagibius sp. Alg239-R121]
MYPAAAQESAQITTGVSCAQDPASAAKEFFEAVNRPNLDTVLFFCSPQYDLAVLSGELNTLFGDVHLVGCTTAGEITPRGYIEGSITGVGFSAPDFVAVSEVISDLKHLSISLVREVVQSAIARLDQKAPNRSPGTTFAFLMIDGMSQQEEQVASSVFNALGDIPLLGGSAGDDLSYVASYVFQNGSFHSASAALVLVHTRHPFRIFKTEHFSSTGKKMVVTAAGSDRRVEELNAVPAAREYARVIGLPKEELNPLVFAAHPLVVRVGGEYHVRSIQRVNEDDSLSFLCAIDEGIVLTVAESGDIVQDLENQFAELRASVNNVQVVIGCDCILRRLEMERKEVKSAISEILLGNKVIGFSTYGEQYHSMHVNQTFTAVAIGLEPD